MDEYDRDLFRRDWHLSKSAPMCYAVGAVFFIGEII